MTNSLHPVLRYYSVPPDGFIKLKKPTKTLHIPEDFIVEWEDRKQFVDAAALRKQEEEQWVRKHDWEGW